MCFPGKTPILSFFLVHSSAFILERKLKLQLERNCHCTLFERNCCCFLAFVNLLGGCSMFLFLRQNVMAVTITGSAVTCGCIKTIIFQTLSFWDNYSYDSLFCSQIIFQQNLFFHFFVRFLVSFSKEHANRHNSFLQFL